MATKTLPLHPIVEQLDIPIEAVYRLSMEQYLAMVKTGVIAEDDPVEYLDGWLVQKITKNPPHILTTQLARIAVEKMVPDGWFVNSQDPVLLSRSAPEPDVSVVRGDRLDYRVRLPDAKDVPLVIEVADASLRRDKDLKKRLYAEAGIPVYWVINLIEGVIEVYTDPSGPTKTPDYRQRRTYGLNDQAPIEVAGTVVGSLAVGDIIKL